MQCNEEQLKENGSGFDEIMYSKQKNSFLEAELLLMSVIAIRLPVPYIQGIYFSALPNVIYNKKIQQSQSPKPVFQLPVCASMVILYLFKHLE